MKKRFKSGFTLAEVLITIAVIGVVAAITMPTMISSYQYKTVGVKLSKFAANIESNARAYVVTDGSLKTDNYDTFINETLLFTNASDLGENKKLTKATSLDTSKVTLTPGATVGVLKDGTAVQIGPLSARDTTNYPNETYGTDAFSILFNPKVNGLPSTAQQNYRFTVTELGYVFPAAADECLTEIVKNQYVTKKGDFDTGKCKVTSGT